MLSGLLILILEAVFGFFSLLLLARFLMQRARVSFRNQIGQFIVQLTDWLVVPTRRLIPGLFGLDLATLVLVWLLQTILVAAELWLRGAGFGDGIGAALLGLALLGVIETARSFVYLIFGVVIVSAILSWVSPYSPVAPLFNTLSRPFLQPLQRFIPTVANVDLSPLVLLLLLQVVLMLLGYLRAAVLPLAL